MRLFKKKMSRAEAIAKAIDMSEDGDTVDVHNDECFWLTMCVCQPKHILVGAKQSNPVGFRMRNDRQ